MDPTSLPELLRLRDLATPAGAQRAADALRAALPEGETAHLAVLGAVLLSGAVLTFWGRRVFKPVVFLLGFALVGAAAAGLGHQEAGWEGWPLLVVGCGAGLVGGLAALLTFYLSIFATGALAGGGSAALLAHLAGLEPGWGLLAIPAVLGGAAGLFVQRPIICMVTAAQGATVLAFVSADRLAGGDGLTRLLAEPAAVATETVERPWLALCWAGLFAAGMAAQMARRPRRVVVAPAAGVA